MSAGLRYRERQMYHQSIIRSLTYLYPPLPVVVLLLLRAGPRHEGGGLLVAAHRGGGGRGHGLIRARGQAHGLSSTRGRVLGRGRGAEHGARLVPAQLGEELLLLVPHHVLQVAEGSKVVRYMRI